MFRVSSVLLLILSLLSLTLVQCQVQEDHTEVLQHTREPITFYPQLQLDSHMSDDDKWIFAGNLATLTGTKKIRSVNLPININLIFVGFDADGNQGIHLTRQDFEPWFDHLEHVIRHRIVPLNDDTFTTDAQNTPQRPITYSVTTRVIRVSPLVNSILEDAIYWHIRPEDPDVEKHQNTGHDEHRDYYYVDATRFSGVLRNLLEELKLDTTYTLFVLNPKSPLTNPDESYGYRAGFSARELELLRGNFDIADGSFSEFYYRAREGHEDATSKPTDRLGAQYDESKSTVYWYDLSRDSEAWAKAYLANSIKGYYRECTSDDDSDCGFNSRQGEGDIVQLAREIVKNGNEYQKAYLYLAQNYDMASNCLVDTWLSGSRFAFVDMTAGPVTWGPSITGEGSKTVNTKPAVPRLNHAEHHADEEFGTVDSDDEESDDQARQSNRKYLQNIAKKYEQYCKDTAREEEFNLLCTVWRAALDKHMSVQDLIGEAHEGDHGESMTDHFLSKLGAFVSHAYQHVFVPPSPMFDTPFSERIVFDFYLVADHEAYDPLDIMLFNVKEFKHELFKFKLPNQEFTFKIKALSDENKDFIWTAVRSATRTAHVPRLDHSGQYILDVVNYIDSQQLHVMIEALLQVQINDDESRDKIMRHIPILLISTNTSLVIDKRYLARALQSMVIAVQTPAPPTPHVICTPHALHHYLARAPMSQALAATALRLGGLMSPHIGYLSGRSRATQDWAWSVGDSPVSLTSLTGHHFSALQRDIVHRNWVVTGLSNAVQSLNLAVDMLNAIGTTKSNLAGQKLLPLFDINIAYNESCHLITQITAAVNEQDFAQATTLLRPLRTAVQQLKRAAVRSQEELHEYKCHHLAEESRALTEDHVLEDWFTPLIILLDVLLLLALLFFVKRPKRKVKIN